MTVSAITTSLLWGPVYLDGPAIAGQPRGDPASERSVAIRTAIDVVPSDASVSAIHFMVPHLTHRVHVYEFPNPWRATNWGDGSNPGERLPISDEIEYVVVPDDLGTEEQVIVDELVASDYSIVHSRDGFVVLERRP
jgi:hypothetical protein